MSFKLLSQLLASDQGLAAMQRPADFFRVHMMMLFIANEELGFLGWGPDLESVTGEANGGGNNETLNLQIETRSKGHSGLLRTPCVQSLPTAWVCYLIVL